MLNHSIQNRHRALAATAVFSATLALLLGACGTPVVETGSGAVAGVPGAGGAVAAGVALAQTGKSPTPGTAASTRPAATQSAGSSASPVTKATKAATPTAGPTLRIGIKYEQPGVGFMADAGPTGLDVDVAAYVAWKLGYSPYDVDWVEVGSKNREKLLTTGVVDMVVASYSITPERRKDIDFAGPYLVAGQDILVRTDETRIKGVSDLRGKIICVVPGATSTDRILKLVGSKVRKIEEPQYADCVRHIINGEADALSTDDVILAGLAATNEFFGRVRLLGLQLAEEQYGIGLPPGSPGRCNLVNQALISMVEDGSWQRFIDRHTSATGYSPATYNNPPKPQPCD
ncbi:MAG: glutamate ABC transporter substrate-binding protein [Cellulomonadaceae bacterium]|jgi:glutamate transport system substrate-binding protein|nr:glutamate ABC transporter substrate-binding protein [Cellulomonadaceae bacterium]